MVRPDVVVVDVNVAIVVTVCREFFPSAGRTILVVPHGIVTYADIIFVGVTIVIVVAQ